MTSVAVATSSSSSSSSRLGDDHVKALTVEVHELREQLLELQEQQLQDRASHVAVVNELSLELLELRSVVHALVEWSEAAPTFAQFQMHVDALWHLADLKSEERLEQVSREKLRKGTYQKNERKRTIC
jgi:predicted glycosyl hydrolase (DUF1957 family)